eukprot:scaffold7239_cov261-Skeletonema_menzelii.AAC.1
MNTLIRHRQLGCLIKSRSYDTCQHTLLQPISTSFYTWRARIAVVASKANRPAHRPTTTTERPKRYH